MSKKILKSLQDNFVLSVILADIIFISIFFLIFKVVFDLNNIFYLLSGWIGAEFISNSLLLIKGIRTHKQWLEIRGSR
jgi:hypothetical protein